MDSRFAHLSPSGEVSASRGAVPSSLRFVEQRQDHFDGTNDNTWNQAYYVNDTFWKGAASGAPVFLCVGGEGPPLTPAVVVNSVHCSIAAEWLQETGALMFALEHRYYGCHNMSACPVDSFQGSTRDTLKYLSSRQALGDLAAFRAYAARAYGLTEQNKWVSWGGSYPGMLAGWFRLKFPHLVHAAVSSSAPVRAKLDMYEYNDHVAYAYTVESVGGSAQCAATIAEGHKDIGALMQNSSGRAQLASLFARVPSAEWLEDPDNRAAFAGEGVAYFPAQSNDPACDLPLCNIDKICSAVGSSKGSAVEKLASLSNGQAEWVAAAPTGDSQPDFWFWQTCNEFGFYQSCETGSKCMFTQGLATGTLSAGCGNEFNISDELVAANINYTNVYYGGLKPEGTRVLWANGEVDPWSTLAVLETTRPEQPTLYVKGASHHAWTHAALPTDQPTVVSARDAIRQQVTAWLKEN